MDGMIMPIAECLSHSHWHRFVAVLYFYGLDSRCGDMTETEAVWRPYWACYLRGLEHGRERPT